MKKVINMVKRILAAMGCAYKEAAPYMNICHYDCQTVQIVYYNGSLLHDGFMLMTCVNKSKNGNKEK